MCVSFPVARITIFRIISVCNGSHPCGFLLSSEFNLTGKPFIHPDGSAVVYNPATVGAPAAGRNPQQGKTPQQPIPAPTQQQQTNHLHSQVSGRDYVYLQDPFLTRTEFMLRPVCVFS